MKKHKKNLGPDWDTKKCWHTWAIQQYVNSWKYMTTDVYYHCHIYGGRYSWYPYFWQEAHIEATHCPCRREVLTKAGVMRKLAGTIHAAARRHYSNYKYSHSCLAVDSKPEDHHGCISHSCAISSTTPDQQQMATSSKNSATTQQQLKWILAHCGVPGN